MDPTQQTMFTYAKPVTRNGVEGWEINCEKMWISGQCQECGMAVVISNVHKVYDMFKSRWIFARYKWVLEWCYAYNPHSAIGTTIIIAYSMIAGARSS
jgi:hypothetical protein